MTTTTTIKMGFDTIGINLVVYIYDKNPPNSGLKVAEIFRILIYLLRKDFIKIFEENKFGVVPFLVPTKGSASKI